MTIRKVLHIILLIAALESIGQTPAAVDLKTAIASFKNDKALKHASWSLCVMNTKTGAIIAKHNEEAALTPASVTKIVTTGAALGILGANFRFETLLQYNGTIDSNGILNGNIYIKGGGDPTIHSDRFHDSVMLPAIFKKWFIALQKNNIKKINGYIIADSDIFDDAMPAPKWAWNDIGNYYGSGTCGLSCFENSYNIYFNSGKNLGDSTFISKIEPPIPQLKMYNFVTAGKPNSGDNVIIYGAPYTYERFLEGTVPANRNNFKVSGALPDPAYYFAQAFQWFLTMNNIASNDSIFTTRMLRIINKNINNQRIVIARHYSPPLENIVYFTNLKSVNMFAETMLKMCGYKQSGYGSYQTGTEAIINYWKSKGIDFDGLFLADGSGLSRNNALSALQITHILRTISLDKNFKIFFNSLAIAGKSGSIAGNFKNTAAFDNLRAKSGFMEGVRSYAGYVTNTKNEMLTFAIIVNNYNCTASQMKVKLEDIMVAIANQ